MERATLDADGEGRTALFGSNPRTVLLSLSADERVPPHTHPEADVLFQVLDGEFDLDLGDETHHLTAGEIARFDGDQEISPRAVTDARALVVLAD